MEAIPYIGKYNDYGVIVSDWYRADCLLPGMHGSSFGVIQIVSNCKAY